MLTIEQNVTFYNNMQIHFPKGFEQPVLVK